MPGDFNSTPKAPGQVPALIEIHSAVVGGDTLQTVDARDLYAFLGANKEFSAWFGAQVRRANLKKDRDFKVFSLKGGNPTKGGRPKVGYLLAIDAAKHIAMMSGTAKGEEVRDYFLKCERMAKAAVSAAPSAMLPDLSDPKLLLRLLTEHTQGRIEAEKRAEVAEAQVGEMTPTVAAFDLIANADGSFCLTDAAKMLGIPPRKLMAWTDANGWTYQRYGTDRLAYQSRIKSGQMIHKVMSYPKKDGSEGVSTQARVTAKGLADLAKAFSVTLPKAAPPPVDLFSQPAA